MEWETEWMNHLLGHSQNGCKGQDWTRPKPEACNSTHGSHVDDRGPNTSLICCCFPSCIRKELDWDAGIVDGGLTYRATTLVPWNLKKNVFGRSKITLNTSTYLTPMYWTSGCCLSALCPVHTGLENIAMGWIVCVLLSPIFVLMS